MHRDQHVGLQQIMHRLEIRAVGMARHVVEPAMASSTTLTPFSESAFQMRITPRSLPGMDLRRKQEHVALLQLEAPDTCRATAAPLAARRSPWLPVTISIRLRRGTSSRLLRRHGTAGKRSARRSPAPPSPSASSTGPAGRSCARRRARLGQRLQPRHVRGEGRRDHQPGASADQLGQIGSAARPRSGRDGAKRRWWNRTSAP
jgi:hypothetical protein